ncbi:MAG: hypothetical protein LUG18_16305 [Candidatus Azobacteroides sp.]|nr:hypothetical protein [Candidatus Azobacteroides sp.]
MEKFYLLLYDKNDNLLSSGLEEVCVYLTPDTLIWTGAQSADWNNYNNWLDPDETDPYNPANPTSKIPRKCTRVLIPDGLVIYPDLSASSTTYYEYATAQCANITFEHGGEVVRTDLLDYEQAYIRKQLLSNRWYMLSAPLGDFYPGDYYIHNPNPHLDDVYIYTAFFGRSNPESSSYVEGEWTGTFNTPGVKLTAGTGYAVWVDDKDTDINKHDPFVFNFPKYDSGYTIYSWEGNVLHTHPSTRDIHHRFVYEETGVWDRSGGDIEFAACASAPGVKVIVGNPFMAHWDFAAFQGVNPIRNYYQVLDGQGQNFSTYFDYGTGSINTGNPPLDEYIAPMQSILVESTAAFSSLTTHVSHVASAAGVKLRSTENPSAVPALYIDASVNGAGNRTVVVMDKNPALSGTMENIQKVLLKDNLSFQVDSQGGIIRDYPYPVSVYTLSPDNRMLDVQVIAEANISIPVGISTLHRGKVTLSFEGISSFPSAYEFYLVDAASSFFPEAIRLEEGTCYEFEKESDEVFLTDRFSIKVLSSGTDIREELKKENGIRLVQEGSLLRLVSVDGEAIKGIRVSDLQGRTLFLKEGIHEKQVLLHSPSPASGTYLVSCRTESGYRVFKVHY